MILRLNFISPKSGPFQHRLANRFYRARGLCSQSANLFRLTVIAFSLTLLAACGGDGGGGGVTATEPQPQPLPQPLIADTSEARRLLNERQTHPGVAPAAPLTTPLTSIEIQRTVRLRAMNADTLVAGDVYLTTPEMQGEDMPATPGMQGEDMTTTCADGSCGDIPINGNMFTISLDNIGTDIGTRFGLTRVSSEWTPVMVHTRIPENPSKKPIILAQHRSAGLDGSDAFEYLSYGGWLTESAFSVDMLKINDGSNESSLLVGLTYGTASGSRPMKGGGSNNQAWRGAVVGVEKSSGDTISGDLDILFFDLAGTTDLDEINLRNLVNLNTGADVDAIEWRNVPVNDDGTFKPASGDIEGTFYGTTHQEIGGTFNRNGIIGAFGGVRQ